ncbi:hypothetical protein [Azospirillum sp.]|uniref:hypothetical protein n=1 Tax=Azospirillum sp. TaxID=34012 RepID=UPI00262911DF|nr:hypothetical protein [Azospirillum sp.]
MIRFSNTATTLAALSGAMVLALGLTSPVLAQSTATAAQPEWSEQANQRPTKPGDEALTAGTLSIRTATTMPGTVSVYVRNGYPFAIVLTRVDALECTNIVTTDCGLIGQDLPVASGAEMLVRTLRQADPTKTFGVTPTYTWRPAVASK